MKNRSNVYYLDEMKLKPRWFESLGLWRLMARFRRDAVDPETAGLGDGDPRVQQYLDRLRDQGAEAGADASPDAGGGGTLRLPGAAPAGETFLRAAA
jgi:hypothetical protein